MDGVLQEGFGANSFATMARLGAFGSYRTESYHINCAVLGGF
jgi:hypothetical protein